MDTRRRRKILSGIDMVIIMATISQKNAVKKYDSKNTKQYHLKLNINTDKDIIDHLEKQQSIQGYVKKLIRENILKTAT